MMTLDFFLKLASTILIGLVLILTWTTPSYAQSITPLWDALHYHATEQPSTSELTEYKIVAGWIDQYPAKKPKNQQWYPYMKGTRTNDPNLNSSWYLKDKDGNRIHDAVSNRLFVMNPNLDGWANYVNQECIQIKKDLSLADGCFVDGMGDAGFGRMTGIPIDPATNEPMDINVWHNGITKISHAVEGKIILNNVGGGVNIDRYPHNSDTIFASEGFCFSIKNRASFFQQMTLMQNFPVLETARGGTDYRSCLAAFLLGHSKDDKFFDASSSLTKLPNIFRMRLGHPRNDIHRQWAGVFTRDFANGKSVFNVTNKTRTIRFRKAFVVKGHLIKTLILSPHQGEILKLSQ